MNHSEKEMKEDLNLFENRTDDASGSGAAVEAGGDGNADASAGPVASASPDGSLRATEAALEGMIPEAEVERDYIRRELVEREYVSREESAAEAEAAFRRGCETQIRSRWADGGAATGGDAAGIFSLRKSVWDS